MASSEYSTSISISTVLTLIFIVLKLLPGNPVNDWSWWWVLSPIWISALLTLALLFIIGIIFLIFYRKFN